ncbi:MAG: D-tyrosyl-tRNA(Tyr) deacylase [Nitrospiraceae bacterium]|nr:D-tyrosyl-tRNA(Tyr) deacylase [Nitrospiraceae bacterium]
MKAVVQRVQQAAVEADGTEIGRIGLGLLVFLGVAKGDGEADSRFMIDKISGLRIFNDPQGKMNRSLKDTEGSALVISQFTLLGDTTKGSRPGFDQAAPPEVARSLYGQVIAGLQRQGITIESGRFGAHMLVSLKNDGPVTFILDSKES